MSSNICHCTYIMSQMLINFNVMTSHCTTICTLFTHVFVAYLIVILCHTNALYRDVKLRQSIASLRRIIIINWQYKPSGPLRLQLQPYIFCFSYYGFRTHSRASHLITRPVRHSTPKRSVFNHYTKPERGEFLQSILRPTTHVINTTFECSLMFSATDSHFCSIFYCY